MMHTKLFTRSTILRVRPLRPPNAQIPTERHRLFTQNAQLLLVAPRNARPQLSYLGQPLSRRKQTPIARLLSTENKQYVKEQVWLSIKWTAVIWTFIGLGAITWVGIQMESTERNNPTPEEWSFLTRNRLRGARNLLEEGTQMGVIDWPQVGSILRGAIRRLEDANIDGKGISRTGAEVESYDISSKSWPWRAAYFEAVMTCAQAAEHMDNMVLDRTRKLAFPREFMVGPLNPRPRPTPSYMPAAPLEENCDLQAFEKPDEYYARILSGEGFTTDQRLDAALAYADWLAFKGVAAASEEMYRKALDVAETAAPGDIEAIVNRESHVLRPNADNLVTVNLLRAITSFAIHQARNGNVSDALPKFLSVFRARRNAPVASATLAYVGQDNSAPTEGIEKITGLMKKLFRPTPFPDPPQSGDRPFQRSSEKPTCEDGELMLYIGEILFATSKVPDEGIAWTREAVTIAEASLLPADNGHGSNPLNVNKCRECLLTGVQNWETMLQRLAEKQAEGSSLVGPKARGGWLGGRSGHVDGRGSEESHLNTLNEELRLVERLKQRIVREGIDRDLFLARPTYSGY